MEERTLYRPILKEAWQITKNFKSLWFLGLFAAVLGGSGEFELLARIIFKPGSNQGLILGAFESFKTGIQNTLPTGADLWSNLLTLLINAPLNLISLILVLVAIVLIALFIGYFYALRICFFKLPDKKRPHAKCRAVFGTNIKSLAIRPIYLFRFYLSTHYFMISLVSFAHF